MASARSSLVAALSAIAISCGGNVAVDEVATTEKALEDRCDEAPVPAMFKACSTQSDCTITFTLVSCCGSVAAVGINGGSTTALRVFEEACNPHHATCDCDPGPALLDDGSTTDDAEALKVRCEEGRCRTYAD